MERTRKPSLPGDILRELYLEPLGLTIAAFAERIGVSRKTVSAIVNGRAPVSVDMALRISRAFNTTPYLWLNLQQAVAHALTCGAVLAPQQFLEGVMVFFDPAGHPFCFFCDSEYLWNEDVEK